MAILMIQTTIKLTHGKASIYTYFYCEHIVHCRVSFPQRRMSICYVVAELCMLHGQNAILIHFIMNSHYLLRDKAIFKHEKI